MRSSGTNSNRRDRPVRGDLDDLVAEVDVIFHLAAEPGGRGQLGHAVRLLSSQPRPRHEHLLAAAKTCPQKRFVYASSASVYDEAGEAHRRGRLVKPFPSVRHDQAGGRAPLRPVLRQLRRQHGDLRCFSVYGPRQPPDMDQTGDPEHGSRHQSRQTRSRLRRPHHLRRGPPIRVRVGSSRRGGGRRLRVTGERG